MAALVERGERQNVDFVDADFIVRTDFTVVWHSVRNDGLWNNSRF
jgi:hypothetical protein